MPILVLKAFSLGKASTITDLSPVPGVKRNGQRATHAAQDISPTPWSISVDANHHTLLADSMPHHATRT